MPTTVYERLDLGALVSRWRAVLNDPDAPDFCEMDEYGEIEVSPPPAFWHQQVVAVVGRQIEAQLGGESGSYALATSIGVRFPDVCWARSFKELAEAGGSDPLTAMPPICVEVVSPGNRRKQIAATIRADLEAGVTEVVLIEQDGRIRWFDQDGEREASAFGLKLTLPD
jgi:Uma2 family endonuclease